MTIKNIAYLFFSVCVLCFALISVALAWTTPTSTPPNDNVSAPINVGSTAQGKAGSLGVGSTDMTTSSSGKFFRVTDTTNGPAIELKFSTGTDDKWSLYVSKTYSDRLVLYANGANRLVVNKDGKVGIGTSDSSGPTSLLSVGSASPFQVDANGDMIKIKGATYSWPSSYTSGTTAYLKNDGSGNLAWTTISSGISGTANYISKFATSTTLGNSVIYESSSNIGIGTTSPGAKLEVAGQVKITGGTPGSGKVLTSDSSGLASWQTPATSGVTGTGTANYFPYWTSSSALSGTSPIYYSSGNIGIGTTSPGTNILQIGTSSQGFGFYLGGTAADFNSLSVPLYINSGGQNTYLNNAGGKVGIGTISPGVSLDVSGGIRARGGAPGSWGVNNNGYAFSGTGDYDGGMFSSADGQIEFYTNSYERMRINSNGYVGIGTTSPGAKLDVYGGYTKVDGGYGITFSTNTNTYLQESYGIVAKLSSSSYEQAFRVKNSGGTQVLAAKGDGKVNIGNEASKSLLLWAGGGEVDLESIGSALTINYDSGQNVKFFAGKGNGTVDINGLIQIRGGNPQRDYILVSGDYGLAHWQSINSLLPSYSCGTGKAIQSVSGSSVTCVSIASSTVTNNISTTTPSSATLCDGKYSPGYKCASLCQVSSGDCSSLATTMLENDKTCQSNGSWSYSGNYYVGAAGSASSGTHCICQYPSC